MKLVWSPERASKAYINTIKSLSNDQHLESGVAELISSMAAGWNAQMIVETWSRGGAVMTSIGLAVASRHTGGRHICLVPDEKSKLEYMEAIRRAGVYTEVIVGEAEEAMGQLQGIDFLVVDSQREDFTGVVRLAQLSSRGAVLICKNATSKASTSEFRWRSILDSRSRVVRSLFLPVGKGLDIAYVGSSGPLVSGPGRRGRRWITHVDQETGELHVFRR